MKRGAWLVVAAASSALSTPGLRAEGGASWPNWLGPTQNGAAVDPGAFTGKATLQLHKAWSRPLENGHAGLAVADGRVFTLFRDDGEDYAVALRADTGAEIWRAKLGKGVESPYVSGPASTPAVADGRVFTLASSCLLRAHEAASGRTLWEIDVKQRFGAAFPIGCASSPFTEAGRLYLQAGGRQEHRFAALDAATGGVLWTSKGKALAVNASPVAAELAGVRQVLSHHSDKGRLGVTAFQMKDGVVLWSAPIAEAFSFDTPFVLPGDRVGLQTVNELHVLQVASKDGVWSAAPAWRTPDLQSGINPPVLHDGHLFGFSGDDLACVALAGRTAWKQKIYPGSLILVDGHLVVLSTTAGLLRVVEATSSGYREKARLQVFNKGAQAWTQPSYAGRRVFVRNEEEVAAVDVR